MTETTAGIHCILELYSCPFNLLDDMLFVRNSMKEASKQGMATLLNLISHKFHPQGVTALALLAESHISIHTWPENGYAAVDVFTCGQSDPRRACEYLVKQFQAQNHSLRILPRGEYKDSANSTDEMIDIKDEPLCPVRN